MYVSWFMDSIATCCGRTIPGDRGETARFFTGSDKVFEVVIGDCPVATAPNDSISRRQKRINK